MTVDTLYNEFKAAEITEKTALDHWSEANYARPRDAAECRRLSDLHDLAYARYRCALSALSTALIPRTPVDVCAHCGTVHRVADMAALDTDYTADQASYSWGIARDDLLCQGCRDELESEFGRESDECDGTDEKYENAMDR